MAMTLVSTTTVGAGGAASIEFTNIPQTGKDLLLLVSSRRSNTNSTINLNFNGENTSFTLRRLRGSGSAVTSDTDTYLLLSVDNDSGTTSSTFSNLQMYFSNYASSANKSCSIDGVTENNATAANQTLFALSRSNTAAISSLGLSANAGTFVQHSTFSLYIIS